jgi:hypothetical protein
MAGAVSAAEAQSFSKFTTSAAEVLWATTLPKTRFPSATVATAKSTYIAADVGDMPMFSCVRCNLIPVACMRGSAIPARTPADSAVATEDAETHSR